MSNYETQCSLIGGLTFYNFKGLNDHLDRVLWNFELSLIGTKVQTDITLFKHDVHGEQLNISDEDSTVLYDAIIKSIFD